MGQIFPGSDAGMYDGVLCQGQVMAKCESQWGMGDATVVLAERIQEPLTSLWLDPAVSSLISLGLFSQVQDGNFVHCGAAGRLGGCGSEGPSQHR